MSFGECELDLRTRRLRRPGGQTVLQEQPFRILLRLLDRPGGVVTREEIRQELWADDTFVDFEHSINAAVKRLRDALGDSTETPRYVETVPRQGYRLIAPLAGAAPAEATAEAPRRSRRWWPPVAGVSLLLVAAVAAGVFWVRARRGPALELRGPRLAVAVFENRTGDAGLDALGLMASDWIAQGLLQDLGLEVVPGLVVLELELGRGESPTPGDRVRRLGSQVGASLVVSGEYYQIGDELRFQARLTDLAGRLALPRLEPVAGPHAAPAEVVTRLRAQVLGAVGLSVKGAGQMTEGIPQRMLGKPPVYEAYREFAIAMRYGEANREKHVFHLERALELDPGFSVPVPRLFLAYLNGGEFEKADRLMKRTWDLVPPGLEPLRDHLAARLAGHLEQSHELALQVQRLLPRNPPTVNMVAASALRVGRPLEARRILDTLDPPPPGGVRWLTLSAQADHLLGRYDAEREAGRAGQAAHPAAAWPREAQVRGLAAAGREADLAALVRESLGALAARGGTTPAHLMVRAAHELRAHGHPEASRAFAAQALEWLAQAPPPAAASEALRRLRGDALLALERREEAQGVFAGLASDHPTEIAYLGELGVLAARRGRKDEADGFDRTLSRLDRPGLLGENTYWRAAIAAALGEKDRALGLLRQAFAEGQPLAWATHAEPAFESLRGDAGYQALVLPEK